jgi:hypothetical protein
VGYKPHSSILDITGSDAGNERYCCFLAQMKLICDAAESSGLPGDSLLLLFTKSAWLTKRTIFNNIRSHMLGAFQDCGGMLVNGREFFDVKGSWPVAFTVWRYKGPESNLDPHRTVPLTDLTWLKKEQLAQIPWGIPEQMERACRSIISSPHSMLVEMGQDRVSIRGWSGKTMLDFKRDRRKSERNQVQAGGLPIGDRRHKGKKVYGASDGPFIGFMDDLTPCRVKISQPDRPWFRLNNQFMDIKKNRCLSGPPTNRGYCANDLESAEKLFFWYALARTFIQHPYAMWADSDDMWAPPVPEKLNREVFQAAFAIGYAENECLQTRFPANNPVAGSPEIIVNNPMTPLDRDSFWSKTLRPRLNGRTDRNVTDLLGAVDDLFSNWRKLLKDRTELPLSDKAYFISDGSLTVGAGIVQIKDYATDRDEKALLKDLQQVQCHLRLVKSKFFEMVTSRTGLNYFGTQKKSIAREFALPQKTSFDKTLAKRLALAGVLVHRLNRDANFGRTKFSKLFYLADTHEGLNLETQYYRESAGPLDPRALYNASVGIESLAQKYRVFTPEPKGGMVRYRPAERLDELVERAQEYLETKTDGVYRLAELFRKLDTDQSEIIATLYACWNDLLLRKRKASDEDIVNEFVYHWHPRKARFPKRRLLNALKWMRENNLAPKGVGKLTAEKPGKPS